VLRGRIFGPRRNEVTGEWRLHNEELIDLYCSPNIIWVIELKRIRWAWHVARMGRGQVHTGFWWGNLKERGHLEDPGMAGRIIVIWISGIGMGGAWTGLIWLKTGHVAGTCDCCNEPSGPTKCGEFIDEMRTS
jgi:hypothetical protein